MSQNKLSIWVHLVWGVKDRKGLISEKIKPLLYNKIYSIAQNKGYLISEMNGMSDHIHLLICLNPVHSISGIMKEIKGGTSNWVNQQKLTEEYFEWQDGYGAFSVSSFMVATVRKYIQNQELHHDDKSFEEEIKYLEKLGNTMEKRQNVEIS